MIKAARGDTVTVRYSGRLADGTLFDASRDDRPLRFILGLGEVIPGFDAAVGGMFLGESRTVTIPCAEAYGAHDPRRIQTFPRRLLPAEVTPVVGRQLEVTGEGGKRLRLLITALDETNVTVDANHPLAGQDLTFEITLLEVLKQPGQTTSLFPHAD